VQPPKKGGDGNGEAPLKVCENCDELVHISVMVCPACDHPFPVREAKKLQLHDDDIMGLEGQKLEVTSWTWRWHTSKASGKQMLAVTYYGSLSDGPITEYLPILHDGYAGQMALQKLLGIARSANCVNAVLYSKGHDIAIEINKQSTPPSMIEYRKDGKFFKVTRRKWA
jgi:DNA repair protein RadD